MNINERNSLETLDRYRGEFLNKWIDERTSTQIGCHVNSFVTCTLIFAIKRLTFEEEPSR